MPDHGPATCSGSLPSGIVETRYARLGGRVRCRTHRHVIALQSIDVALVAGVRAPRAERRLKFLDLQGKPLLSSFVSSCVRWLLGEQPKRISRGVILRRDAFHSCSLTPRPGETRGTSA
jgi:hypothetical protein